jgi:hypothetical protein
LVDDKTIQSIGGVVFILFALFSGLSEVSVLRRAALYRRAVPRMSIDPILKRDIIIWTCFTLEVLLIMAGRTLADGADLRHNLIWIVVTSALPLGAALTALYYELFIIEREERRR